MVTKRVGDVLKRLAENPYMTLPEMAGVERRGTTALDGHIKKAEEVGLVSHVLHSLRRRNGERRYMLTGDGVGELVAAEAKKKVPRAEVLERVGTSGRGLSRYYELIDTLAVVYKTAATVAAGAESPLLSIHPLSDGPLDAVVRVPDAPYSLGVMCKRPSLRDDFLTEKLWRYANRMENRPSVLLVVAPGLLAEHYVKRLVQREWDGLFLIASMDTLGDPKAQVWCEPNRPDGRERVWSMRQVLAGIHGESVVDYKPTVTPFRSAAVPGPGWAPAIVLTLKQRRALYAIADWPLAYDYVLEVLAGLSAEGLGKALRRLRKHGLVHRVRVRRRDWRMALTGAGIRYVCRAARAASDKARAFWSSDLRPNGRFVGSKLAKLRRERLHTDMVYDIVARVVAEAEASPDIAECAVVPAHLAEWRPVTPDARIDLVMESGTRRVLLLEAERAGLSRAEMQDRFATYARVFDTDAFQAAFPVRPQVVAVLEDPGDESNFAAAQVRAGRTSLPLALTNLQDLAYEGGFFKAVWRRPGEYDDRARFWELTE